MHRMARVDVRSLADLLQLLGREIGQILTPHRGPLDLRPHAPFRLGS